MLLEIAEQLQQKPGFRANTLATRMHIHERQVYAVAGAELVDVARRILGRDPDAAAMQAARAAATPPPAPATAATAPAPISGGSGGGGGSDRYQPPAGLSPAQSALLVALATQKFQDQPEANFVAMMSQYERVVANRDDAAIATLATSFRVTLSAPTTSTSPSPTAAPTQAAAPATATQTAATTATPPPPPAAVAPANAPVPTSGGSGGSARYQPPAGLSPAQSALLVALATQKFQDQPEANFVALMTQYERVVANRDDATIATLATSFRVTLSAPTASTSPSPTAAPTPATTATPSDRPTMVCPNQACVSSREDSSEEDSDEDDDHGVVPVYCGMCGTKLVEG